MLNDAVTFSKFLASYVLLSSPPNLNGHFNKVQNTSATYTLRTAFSGIIFLFLAQLEVDTLLGQFVLE